jgi:hypothetical protein
VGVGRWAQDGFIVLKVPSHIFPDMDRRALITRTPLTPR